MTTRNIIKDVNEIVATWREYLDGLGLLAHYDTQKQAIIVDYIMVPAAHRRQGFASQILDEFKDVAAGHEVPLLIQPDDGFGTPRPVLVNLYAQNGFVGAHNEFMRWEA